MKKRFLLAAILLLIGFEFAFAKEQMPLANVSITTKTDESSFLLEVAATPESRGVGLMNRWNIGQFQGMLFLFPKEKDYEFWMSNTYIPLDIIFIDANDNIVHIEENATPQSLRGRRAKQLVKTVIELPGETARDENLQVGDHVSIILSQPVEIR